MPKQRKLFDIEPKYVEQIKPKSFDDLIRMEEMMTKANKICEDNDVLVKYEDGKTAYEPLKGYLKRARDDIDAYISSIGACFDSNVISKNIEHLSKRKKITIPQLERILGLSPGYISRASSEESRRRLSIDVVYEIAGVFGVTIDTLANKDIAAVKDDIRPIADFIERLSSQTEKRELKWVSFDDDASSKQKDEYTKYLKINDLIIKKENAFKTHSNKDDIIFGVVMLSDGPAYLISIGSTNLPTSDDSSYQYMTICYTAADVSGTLDSLGEKLHSCILNHKDDYNIPISVGKYIHDYLNN